MFGVATFNLPNYTELANITDLPKIEYCDKHGYKFFALREKTFSHIMGFNKIHYTLALFNQYPALEWLLFCECDAMITNLTIRIEDKINNNFHFIVPLDRLGINSGNFLARNTKEGRDYLQMIIDSEEENASEFYAEQHVISTTYEKYKNIVGIVPQKHMNSYESQLYLPYADVTKDAIGLSGEWEEGDWIIHWPGFSDRPGLGLPLRVERATALSKLVIR